MVKNCIPLIQWRVRMSDPSSDIQRHSAAISKALQAQDPTRELLWLFGRCGTASDEQVAFVAALGFDAVLHRTRLAHKTGVGS